MTDQERLDGKANIMFDGAENNNEVKDNTPTTIQDERNKQVQQVSKWNDRQERQEVAKMERLKQTEQLCFVLCESRASKRNTAEK